MCTLCGSLTLWRIPGSTRVLALPPGQHTTTSNTNRTHTCMHTYRLTAPVSGANGSAWRPQTHRPSAQAVHVHAKDNRTTSLDVKFTATGAIHDCGYVLLRAAPAAKSPAQLSQLLPLGFLCMCPSPIHGLCSLQLISITIMCAPPCTCCCFGQKDKRIAGCCRCCTGFPAAPADAPYSHSPTGRLRPLQN